LRPALIANGTTPLDLTNKPHPRRLINIVKPLHTYEVETLVKQQVQKRSFNRFSTS